jgi:hypothetical protein
MMRIARKLLLGVALSMAGLQAQALVITGADCGTTLTCWPGPSGPPANNPTVADIEAITGSTNLIQLYKSDVSGSTGFGLDSFVFASSYDTVFANSAADPQDALISYISGATINCPECFLLVKDGASDPNWYLFDITSGMVQRHSTYKDSGLRGAQYRTCLSTAMEQTFRSQAHLACWDLVCWA